MAVAFVRHRSSRGQAIPTARVIDPALAGQLIAMLETITQDGGTGTRAAVAHYRVAGKTGTSRKASAQGYDSRYVASFAGMAPASSPERCGGGRHQ